MQPVLGIIGLVVCFLLILLRMPIAFAFGFTGFIGIWLIKGLQPALHAMGTIPYTNMAQYTLSVIPLFLLLGYIAQYSELAKEFYDGARRWIGGFRGGLALAIVIGNAFFGACCGSGIAAATTFSSVTLPETRKYGYADSLTLGAISGGSILSTLIPPSFAFVINGILTNISIGKLFMAGLFPGLILVFLYTITIMVICRWNPALGPAGPKTTLRDKMTAATGMWTLIIIFVVMMGGLYFGVFTPTEAAGAGSFIVIVMGLARRKLNWQRFKHALVETGIVSAMVFFMLIGTIVFNTFLVETGAAIVLGDFINGISHNSIGNLFVVVIVFLALGTFLDTLPVVLLLLPIMFPVAVELGVNPLQYMVVQVIAGTLGTLTPPFGIVVYSMSTVIKDVPLFKIFSATYPFYIANIILLLLVIFFPQIASFLPSMMYGG